MEGTKMTLKLLVCISGRRVLFAEAGKDFVDFLFSIHSMPLGTVTKLLGAKTMTGSLGNLYESIENLDASYMQPSQSKDPLLSPYFGSQAPLLLPKSASSSSSSTTTTTTTTTRDLYKCTYYYGNDCGIYVTEVPNSKCPSCKNSMSVKAAYVAPPKSVSRSSSSSPASATGGGYVKGVVTYTVMDDLVVKPMSTISSITLLNQFHVKDLGSLEEKVVELGIEEGMEILRASFKSKTVLTDVFFPK